MYHVNVLVFSFVAWIFFSSKCAQVSGMQSTESSYDFEQCNKENYGRLVKDMDGKENLFICSKLNGNYTWKMEQTAGEIDDENEVIDKIWLKREASSEFFQRGRRNVYEECYGECCRFEEVRENHKPDRKAAIKYWRNFKEWNRKKNYCRRKSGWSW